MKLALPESNYLVKNRYDKNKKQQRIQSCEIQSYTLDQLFAMDTLAIKSMVQGPAQQYCHRLGA